MKARAVGGGGTDRASQNSGRFQLRLAAFAIASLVSITAPGAASKNLFDDVVKPVGVLTGHDLIVRWAGNRVAAGQSQAYAQGKSQIGRKEPPSADEAPCSTCAIWICPYTSDDA
jgi:hypothetical protein